MKPPKAKTLLQSFQDALIDSFNNMVPGEPSRKIEKIIIKSARRLSKDLTMQLRVEHKASLKAERKKLKSDLKMEKQGTRKTKKTLS
jgi:hypothetical protein